MLNRNRKTSAWWNSLRASSQNLTNYFPPGVGSVLSPPPLAPTHMGQNLHHFDIPLLFNFVPRSVQFTVRAAETLKGHGTQCGAGRAGPLGVSPDGREGLQPAPDHLQGE